MIQWSRFVMGISLFLALPSILFCQDAEFEKWLQQEDGKIKQFKEERDREFTEFLKREWKQIELLQGDSPIEKPKPVEAPVYEGPAPVRPPSEIKPVISVKPITKTEPMPETKPAGPKTFSHDAEIKYFDVPLRFGYNDIPAIDLHGSITKEQFSRAWDALSGWDYKPVLEQMSHERDRRHLNDWGFVLLVYQTGKSIYAGSSNEAALLTWFILSKAGYEVKIGYNEKVVLLLFPAENRLYSVQYFMVKDDARRFYAPQVDRTVASPSTLYTFNGKYPGADRPLQFEIRWIPTLLDEKVTKEFSFDYGGQTYHVKSLLSKDAIRFFEYYPQTNYEVYFNAPFSQEAVQSLLPQLSEIIKGKSETEAVNIILRCVQTAFQYKTDPEQFGREKSFFPDETLFYPYSDCEDRAILFSYLVHNLINYEVVGLQYPEHVATAVRFQGNVAGDAVDVHGTKYLVCDPTYINADIGMCMTRFKNTKPTIIRINSR